MCGGYIAGVIDQWGGFDAPKSLSKLQKCFPDGVTLTILLAVTTDYLTAAPGHDAIACQRGRRGSDGKRPVLLAPPCA